MIDGGTGTEDRKLRAYLVATRALKIKALTLHPTEPVTWASGYRMPIYNDNRLWLGGAAERLFIARQFMATMKEQGINPDVVAGTSTAGISPGTTLADEICKPFCYVRDKPKDHGLKNQIEGIPADQDLGGKLVVLVEDLISTGGSSAKAVQAIRNAKGTCNVCLCIYNYGFAEAAKMFAGEAPYEQGNPKAVLAPPCRVLPLMTYDDSLAAAKQDGYITQEQEAMLKEWRLDPFNWGAKHGFPPVKKDAK